MVKKTFRICKKQDLYKIQYQQGTDQWIDLRDEDTYELLIYQTLGIARQASKEWKEAEDLFDPQGWEVIE